MEAQSGCGVGSIPAVDAVVVVTAAADAAAAVDATASLEGGRADIGTELAAVAAVAVAVPGHAAAVTVAAVEAAVDVGSVAAAPVALTVSDTALVEGEAGQYDCHTLLEVLSSYP